LTLSSAEELWLSKSLLDAGLEIQLSPTEASVFAARLETSVVLESLDCGDVQ
jgi:hypothetical protein